MIQSIIKCCIEIGWLNKQYVNQFIKLFHWLIKCATNNYNDLFWISLTFPSQLLHVAQQRCVRGVYGNNNAIDYQISKDHDQDKKVDYSIVDLTHINYIIDYMNQCYYIRWIEKTKFEHEPKYTELYSQGLNVILKENITDDMKNAHGVCDYNKQQERQQLIFNDLTNRVTFQNKNKNENESKNGYNMMDERKSKCIIQLKEFVQNMHHVMIKSNRYEYIFALLTPPHQGSFERFADQIDTYGKCTMYDIKHRVVDEHEILQFVDACINFDQFVKDIPILGRPQRDPDKKKKY